MVLLLGACLFFPIGPRGETYDAQALAVGRDLFEDGDFTDVLLRPRTALVIWARSSSSGSPCSRGSGIGGRWSVWVAGIALLLGVLGPLVLAWKASGTECVTCHDGLEAVVGRTPGRLPGLHPAGDRRRDRRQPLVTGRETSTWGALLA